jgi:excinuclease ABC subunit A
MSNSLKITHARENNLKDINVEIKHDELTVITGLSGSGKSSLAFDTVYAEGQRRYLETFSSYTRQFFDLVKKPDADLIEHVRPAIAIEQKTKIRSSRSTVGSVAGINEYLKVIWNYFSEAVCPACSIQIETYTPKSGAIKISNFCDLFRESIFVICAPIKISLEIKQKGSKSKSKTKNGDNNSALALERLKILGFSRAYDPKKGTFFDLADAEAITALSSGILYIAIERIKKGSHSIESIAEAIDRAYSLSYGECALIELKQRENRPLSSVINCPSQINIKSAATRIITLKQNPTCEYAGINLKQKRPSLFSFNHPYGACEKCKGFGSILEVDRDKCISDKRLSIAQGALQCWSGDSAGGQMIKLAKFCLSNGISTNTPWQDLSADEQDLIFLNDTPTFRGIVPWFKKLERKMYKTHVRVFVSRYRKESVCGECNGSRLNSSALSYKISGISIADINQMPLSEIEEWLISVVPDSAKLPRQIKTVFNEFRSRIRYLIDVGLPYLTLGRQSNTLSGGETQRVNLASAIGSNLVSTQFILDEPTVGLHARDTKRLIKAIEDLRDRGNSVLVVEHDTEVMANADNIIEIGPGAGSSGGRLVFSGPTKSWPGISTPEWPQSKPLLKNGSKIKISKASVRNLKSINLEIPLNSFVTISGVSGSGKSTLLHEVIVAAAESKRLGNNLLNVESVIGLEQVDDVILVDQSPISKTPRGNIATYTDIWSAVRKLLAETEDAKTRKLTASSFSFNVDAGRCPTCRGAGFIREDMQFLSDVYIQCESCLGKRFQQKVLEVQYKGLSVADLLDMSIADAETFFEEIPSIHGVAKRLSALGLHYLRLGHPLSELSGGEAQRLKLTSHLDPKLQKRYLFLFDEPTTGLHLHDIARLAKLFRELIAEGHSVICVEHNLSLISASDWIIDMGPEGGAGGGRVLFEGPPRELIKSHQSSHTGRCLHEQVLKDTEDSSKILPIKPTRKSKISRDIDAKSHIRIRGAREHNLKNLDLDIPLNKMVVFTGVSGSGKSSIAKDIIYSEGQRSYLDCMSPYARQFIKELKQAEVDSIAGVPPTICVYQHTFQPGMHSTVGTLTEVYNFLRLFYAKIGKQHCPDHPHEVISPLSASDIADEICSRKEGIKILSPIIKGKKGFHKDIIARAQELELAQIRVDGQLGAPSKWIEGLERNKAHTIEYVIASFNPKTADKELVREAISQGLSLGEGSLIILAGQQEDVLSTARTCPACKRGFLKPDPEDLSFSSRRGRCSSCDGLGILDGETCSECGGSRLTEIGRNLRIDNLTIHELSLKPLEEICNVLNGINLNKKERALTELLIAELLRRINLLKRFGVGYLPLNRPCAAISGGELQRLRLAAALGASLSGVMYILDEPSAGLHPDDNVKVLETLQHIKDEGNSLLVIEHDPTTILASDYIIDIGPGGGARGGKIMYEGEISNFMSHPESETALALRGHAELKIGSKERSPIKDKLRIRGSKNNIKGLKLDIPLNSLVGVIGVSGAGKSTLVEHMLAHTILDDEEGKSWKPGTTWSKNGIDIESDTTIHGLYFVDQKPLGKTSRSIPASYLGIWDEIRKVMAMSPGAKSRGWKENFFSFNSGKGRCPECKGLGEIVLEMSFLPTAKVPCERCRGKRFIDEALTVKFNNFNISDVLEMTIEEARLAFATHRKINHVLNTAAELGLGYLKLGQSTATLSGGEAQRLKLTLDLAKPKKEPSLYILDEPTAGLHMSDVKRLIKALQGLVDKGHSVIVIEHDEQVIRNCHHLIELGPGADLNGGNVIFSGPLSNLLKAKTPWSKLLIKSPTATSSGKSRVLNPN